MSFIERIRAITRKMAAKKSKRMIKRQRRRLIHGITKAARNGVNNLTWRFSIYPKNKAWLEKQGFRVLIHTDSSLVMTYFIEW